MTTKKKFTNQNNIFDKLIWGVIFVLVFVMTSYFRNSEYIKKHSDSTDYNTKSYSTDTNYKKYTGVSGDDSLIVNVDDKLTGKQNQYTIDDLSASVKRLENLSVPSISSSNKNYVKQNSTLVSEASAAYGFIISNDYKTVKFCSKYYPVSNLKRKFDIRFQYKKLKAEKILNNAFGVSGAKNLEVALMSNTSMIQTFQKQMEDDYQSVRKLAAQDGIPNFTKTQYCKMLDESADMLVDEEYDKFKKMLPGF